MANNPRLARLIDLVPFISQHQGIPISQLAEKFGVSVEEIEKDLWLLYCCGLPGQTPLELMEFQFEDGYVSVRNADELKNPRTLTQIEIATLIMGLEILEAQSNSTAGELKRKLSKKLAAQVSFQPSATEMYIPEITKAIQNNQLLEIEYLGKVREIIPFEIYIENQQSYLRAYCKSAKDRRTFSISRISKLKVLDLQELAPNIVPSQEEKLSTKIKVHAGLRRVRETFGDIELIEYHSQDWLLGQVMALGGDVELLDPKLRGALLERIQASKNLYLG